MRKLTHFVLSLAATCLLLACGPSGNSFKVKGQFTDGMNAKEIYIYSASVNTGRIDTIPMREGSFVYVGSTSEPTPYYIVFPNAIEHVIFAGPGQQIEYTAAANDLAGYVVTGSPENDELTRVRQEIKGMNYSQTLTYIRKYISSNPQSLVSIYLFDRYLVQDSKVQLKQINEMLKTLRKNNPDNLDLLRMESAVKAQQTTTVGKKMPDLTLLDQKRDTCRLWTKEAKSPTLIVFWSTWMNGSYDFLWELRKQARKYKDEHGDLRVVGISLDAERYRWESEIHQDSTLIEHYNDGLSFASPTIRKVGIPSIPYYIIVDKKRKIVATGTDKTTLNKDLGALATGDEAKKKKK